MEATPPDPRAMTPPGALIQDKRSARLEAAFWSSHEAWWSLYSDAACWADPDKRQVMLLARGHYQGAKMNWLFSLRFPDLSSADDTAARG